jgi:hypothetical protein
MKTLCKFCNSKTNTIMKKSLSASENNHYRYECKKCGCRKDDIGEMLKRIKVKK